jgi:hypothetical protein
MADLPRFNFDADETKANWIQILRARHQGQMHPWTPNARSPTCGTRPGAWPIKSRRGKP